MANEFVAKNGLISQNNTTISGSLAISASSGIPLQIKGGTGTLLSVSGSTSEIFKISDTFSPNLCTITTGSITVFNIDNNKTVSISGSLVVTGSITGSLQGTASFATTASYISGSVFTSTNPALSASYAQTSSYATVAANGGVTKILAGANVNISPVNGLGDVTVTSFGTNLYNTATGSYGSFYDTGSVSATSATAIYSMSLNTTDISNGVFISASSGDNTRIKFTNAGTYNLQFSSQFSNTDNSIQDVVIWVKKNEVDIPDSSGVVSVPPFKAGSNGQVISGWNYFLNLSANDYVQMCWHVEQANVIRLETIAAGTSPTHPRTPSTILTAQRVDTFLSNTGSFSGSFTGNLIGTATTASYVTSSNIVGTVLSSSYAQTASYVTASNVVGTILSASYAQTASYVVTALTASYVTASNIVGTVLSASYATTASFALTSAGGSGGISQGKVVAIVTGYSNLF